MNKTSSIVQRGGAHGGQIENSSRGSAVHRILLLIQISITAYLGGGGGVVCILTLSENEPASCECLY